MASVIPDSRNFKQTESAFLKQSLFDYSSYLNALPLLVTYYSKDHMNSTYDENLHTVQEILGNDSPIKFNKIIDFPLYKASVLEGTEDESEDVGTEGDVQGTAIIPPQQVYPRVDDLFQIKFYGKETVFRVSAVKRSNIKGKTFFEISYYLYSTLGDSGNLDDQVQNEYKVVGSPSSVTKSAIVSVDKAEVCEKLQTKINNLQNNLKAFYNDQAEAYIIETSYNVYKWDECVHAFVCNNKIFDKAGAYRNEVTLRHIEAIDYPDMYDQYEGSIYWALEHGDYSMLNPEYTGASSWAIFSSESPLRFLQDATISGAIYNSGNIKSSYMTIFGNLKEYLEDTSGEVKPSVTMAESYLKLMKYYHDEPNIDEIDSYINSIIPKRTVYDYYYLPIAIFIFKNLIEQIKNIYNFNN